MNSFRELIVWQRAMELVKDIYVVTKEFPSNEKFGIVDQLRRSAVSIPSNIAEGYGRPYTKEYIRFLQVARGSLFEMETQIEISFIQNYIFQNNYDLIFNKSIEVEKMLNTLIKKLANLQK